ncbi:MAG: NRAMP family divalent metal transporter [Luteibaculaceae bacterium]
MLPFRIHLPTLLQRISTGILYAGAAIGVSHLVQSTRAGALFGLELLWIILAINLIKYPFFETGVRYAGATGKNLLFAYRNIHKSVVLFFLIQTFFTMFVVQSVVTVVAAGLLENLLPFSADSFLYQVLIAVFCVAILLRGSFTALSKLTKILVITLVLCTLLAVLFSFTAEPTLERSSFQSFSLNNLGHLAFLIALLGWMPAPLDISVWQSVWKTSEKKTNRSLRAALFDFHAGYWITTLVAALFLILGAYSFSTTGEPIENTAGKFAAQFIHLYSNALGSWSFYVIALAAFATMLTTCLTCLDANPRVFVESLKTLNLQFSAKKTYVFLVVLLSVAALFIPKLFGNVMTVLVDFATTVSFLTAPVFATLNYRISFGNGHLAADQKPAKAAQVLALVGLVFLYGFSAYFVVFTFLR